MDHILSVFRVVWKNKIWKLIWKINCSILFLPEVESSRMSLALRTHFEVLGLGLEGQVLGLGLESSKIVVSSARGQHYFLNSWNFVGKRQKPHGKFANTFFVFVYWSIGVSNGGGPRGTAPLNWNFTNDKIVYCFFNFSFFLAFFAYNSN